jgi:hypothetical protein
MNRVLLVTNEQEIMNDSNITGCLAVILWIITIGISVGSCILAWDWIEPKSFWGAIKFIIIWGILSYIGHLIAAGIIAIISILIE